MLREAKYPKRYKDMPNNATSLLTLKCLWTCTMPELYTVLANVAPIVQKL